MSGKDGAAHYHQTSPESVFIKAPFINQALPDGHITLTGTQFIVTRQGQRTEYNLADQAAFFEKLEQEFGVELLPELRQTLESRVGSDAGKTGKI